MTELGCPKRELLSAYIDREANPSEERRVDMHLAGCGACRSQVRSLARLKTAVRNQPLPALSADLREALTRIGRDAVAESKRESRGAWMGGALGLLSGALRARPAAVGLALAGLVALLFWSGSLSRAPRMRLPVDLILAAHNQYALTMPLASTEKIMSDLPVQISHADTDGGRDVY